jgi:hypothetical protein
MADYRDLAAALGGGYGQDTGPITPDTLLTLKNGKTASAGDLLGLLKGYGQAVGSNLESLGRGGLSQFLGSPVDIANTIRTPYPMEVFGDVNYTPDKQLPGGSRDILGMMPRATASRPETAGMEELGTVMGPGLAKGAAPVAKGYFSLLGNEINAGMTGQPTRSVIGQMTPKPLQIFIGNNSKAFNTPAAETYLKMEKTDATPEQMWAATGTFRGVDGKLRQEISDVPAQLLNKQKNFEGKLHKTLSHPELFKNYPALQYYDTDITSQIALPEHLKKTLIGRGSGAFTQKDFVTGEPKITAQAYSDEDKKTLIHEIQHAIQAKEGFARGGNMQEFQSGPMFNPVAKELNADLSKVLTGGYTAKPEEVISSIKYGNPQEIQSIVKKYGFDNVDDALSFLSAEDMKRTPFGQYRRLAGEAEARATEARLNLTDKERRAKFPYESYDVPKSDLIIQRR